MSDGRNNVKAGLWVAAAVGGLSASIWAWTAWQERDLVPFVVRFTAQQGVYGLKPGAPVLVGGIPYGEVERIDPTFAGGKVSAYDVHISVRRGVPLRRGAVVGRSDGSVSGDTTIEVRHVGRPRGSLGGAPNQTVPADTMLPPGSVIAATEQEPWRTTVGTNSASRLNHLIAAWRPEAPEKPLTTALEATLDDVRTRFNAVREPVKALSDRVREDWPKWSDELARSRELADSALAKLGIGQDAAPTAVIPSLRAMKDDFAALDAIEFSKSSDAMKRFEDAVAAVRHMRLAGTELSDLLTGAGSALGRLKGDFSIAGQELAATGREALSAPWRLLARPDATEAARQDELDLAGAYAECAVEWRQAMKSVEDALRRDEAVLRAAPGLAELLRARVDAATARFEAASAAMARRVMSEGRDARTSATPRTDGPATGTAPAAREAPAP